MHVKNFNNSGAIKIIHVHILGQTNLITSFSGFQISKPMREAAFYFIF